ncbi:hypothetical protein ACJJIQ_01995 [Microbulbifer sp. ANSA003]|uniref:hypothetical protein n=1 Tax=Microbulbifer sp. ANSA003 TaxID=3243360 RepID=UPI0040410EC6
MSIEIVKLEKQEESFLIWIDEDQSFKSSQFNALLSPPGIKGEKIVHSSVGPAEYIEEITTNEGAFFLSEEFDEWAGATIYSDDTELMNKILSLMLSSGLYHARQ